MASVYDKAEIYDLLEDDARWQANRAHWQAVFAQTPHGLPGTLLDVSIGSGGVTLPLAELGVRLFGSDLSEAMLARCREKAAAKGVGIELRQSDFCAVRGAFSTQFDCVASTGNSLPYVSQEEVCRALEQMDALVKPGGFLYFDMRNWDKILRDRPRFYLYDPIFRDDLRVNFLQVWDYEPDGAMTFHLLYTFERDGHLFHKEKFEERYIPIPQRVPLDKLRQLGYRAPRVMPFPACASCENAREADWYCVLAQKPPAGPPDRTPA